MLFCVAPSERRGANRGLFARQRVARNTVVPCRHSEPGAKPGRNPDDHEVLDFFVPEDVCHTTQCVWDGELRPVVSVVHMLHRDDLKPRYVLARKSEPIMTANDLAWKPGIRAQDYVSRDGMNQLELVLGFRERRLDRIYARFRRDVERGDEIGVTYGKSYWWHKRYRHQPPPLEAAYASDDC